MKTVDYDQLLKKHSAKGQLSKEANDIANNLICEYCIQQGNGLARFLNVEICFDNHMALRIWVQRRLNENKDFELFELHTKLKSELYDLLNNLN